MYFLGLTFHQNFLQFKKIESYRKRFDPNYSICRTLQMTILPPFELPSPRVLPCLIESLEEELDSFFHGERAPLHIQFSQLDLMSGPKRMISLHPNMPSDLTFAQETISEILEHYEVKWKRKGKSFYQAFLPIGRPTTPEQINSAIDFAHGEFTLPLSLYGASFTLFQKCPKYWPVVKRIFYFGNEMDKFAPDQLVYTKERNFCST